MTQTPNLQTQQVDDAEISLALLGATIIRDRRTVFGFMLAGVALSTFVAWHRPTLYASEAAFVVQGAEVGRSGLAGLAGQFGINIPTGGQGQTPEFYVRLLSSRSFLEPVLRDSFTVAEAHGQRRPLLEWLAENSNQTVADPRKRLQIGVGQLYEAISSSVEKPVGLVEVTVTTPYPTLSQQIAQRLLTGVEEFNRRTRQGQASAERKFAEARLEVVSAELGNAERRLANFLNANRQIDRSPVLSFERGRLEREVSLRQSVYTSLAQMVEDARLREVRDSPVITIVDSPTLSVSPEPRRRAQTLILGLLVGGLAGTVLAIARAGTQRRASIGAPDTLELISALGEAREGVLRHFRRQQNRP